MGTLELNNALISRTTSSTGRTARQASRRPQTASASPAKERSAASVPSRRPTRRSFPESIRLAWSSRTAPRSSRSPGRARSRSHGPARSARRRLPRRSGPTRSQSRAAPAPTEEPAERSRSAVGRGVGRRVPVRLGPGHVGRHDHGAGDGVRPDRADDLGSGLEERQGAQEGQEHACPLHRQGDRRRRRGRRGQLHAQSGSAFKVGRTKVTCSATDSSGNIARTQFTITVKRS